MRLRSSEVLKVEKEDAIKSFRAENEGVGKNVDMNEHTVFVDGVKVMTSVENLIDLCSGKENRIEFAKCDKEGKNPVSLDLNLLGACLEEKIKLSRKVAMEFDDRSENVERVSIVDEGEKRVLLHTECDKEDKNGTDVVDENCDGAVGMKERKRGRKRKVVESSEIDGDVSSKNMEVEKEGVNVSGRMLRSRTKITSGSVKVDEIKLNESVVGFKRQMEVECLDQTEVRKGVKESSQAKGRPKKKQKRPGRPPKVQGEMVILEKPKRKETENLSTTSKKPKGKGGSSEITDYYKQTVQAPKEKIDNTTTEDAVKGTGQVKSKFDRLERRQEKELVRDQIVSMIMKAGWTIEHRQRQSREYFDAVYVDEKGKTHWSITKAYFSLKKKIEDGKATNKEVSAYTPIPEEEMSMLFRSFSKVRSDKNQKKKKRGKNKAKFVFSGEAPPKKKPGKVKDGNKKKEIRSKSSKKGPKVTQKGRPSRKPRLVARTSKKGSDEEIDGSLYCGKRNVFSWMIDSGVIMTGSKLQYGEGKRRKGLPEGTVTCDGIHCNCCNEIMDISSFVSHGGAQPDKVLKSICFQSGSSLLKCLLESWKKEEESTGIRFNFVDVEGEDPNDDTCNICGDGGDMICCDGCPSTFNQSCLDIQNFPSGDWHCIYCSCKFCGLAATDASQGDDSHDAPDSEMLTCCMCEKKFHDSCLEDAVNVDFSSLSFCGRKCQQLYEQLQTYIGVKFELTDGFSWALLKRSDDQDSTLSNPLKVLCNCKLAVAFSVMDECFEPITDEKSGVNLIHNVVYNCGSNFTRLNFSGFFTAILERSGELIASASIRIHGHQLAEMPFIGTRNMYRRQGMCRRLLDTIENALGSLGVEELVIPAIPELFDTWTKAFGFKPVEKSKRQAMKSMSIVVFPGTDMLQKPLFKNQVADNNLSPVADDDKAVECISAENDDSLVADASDSEVRLADDLDYKGVSLDYKAVPKVTFDLNLHPAAPDTDIQPMDDDSISRDPHVCKNSFELSDSRDQVDSKATPPLVLV